MHVHVSALDAVITFAYVILVGALWRWASARLASMDGILGQVGKAMGTIY